MENAIKYDKTQHIITLLMIYWLFHMLVLTLFY